MNPPTIPTVEIVLQALTELYCASVNTPERYFGARELFYYGREQVWKNDEHSPNTKEQLEIILDTLFDEGKVRRVITQIKRSTLIDIKAYQPIIE